MPRLSRLSNPTGLIDIEKHRISIVLDENPLKPSYALSAMDLNGLQLETGLNVIVIASRGNSEIRTDHGPVSDWNKTLVDLSELSQDGTWKFRVLLVPPGSKKLFAAAENIRPNGLGESDSIIGLEPANDLDQVPWELKVLETEGRAVIRFNTKLFTSSGAAEADKHFTCFVLPEAVRQLARWHVDNTGAIADEVWQPFSAWLTLMGVPASPPETDSDSGNDWCRAVVYSFCERFRGVDVLAGSHVWGDDE